MRQFGHVKQIVGYSRHNGTRFMLVKVRKRQRLDMLEKFTTHIALNTYAQNMSVILYTIIKYCLDTKNYEQNTAPHQHRIQHFVRRIRVNYVFCDKRIKHIASRNHQRTDYIECEQFFMRFVIRKKTSYHTIFPWLY